MTDKEIIGLYNQGLGLQAVADMCNTNLSAVRKRLLENGVQMRKKGKPFDKNQYKERLELLRHYNNSYSEVARHLTRGGDSATRQGIQQYFVTNKHRVIQNAQNTVK